MKKQIIVIHGGDTFDTHEEYFLFLKKWKIDFEDYRDGRSDWKKSLGVKLGEDFEIIYPNMPNKINAKYTEWKIWFEKFTPYFEHEIILIGHSLGGIFLVKYLSENVLDRKVAGIFLVAPPYDSKHSNFSLADFTLPADLNGFTKQGGKIFIYGSTDDPVVPFIDFEKYKKVLFGATFRKFTDRGHFNQEEFPEIIEDIKSL